MSMNVVLFVTDDHGAWAAGCYGNAEVRTPTLDYLADTGVLFENAYTPSPVCSPARASLFTGRLPSQHGIHDYLAEADPEVRAISWLEGETLLPTVLQQHGYVTGMAGKWHLGTDERPAAGFDYWYCRSAPVSEASGYQAPWPLTPSAEKAYDRHAITDHGIEFLRHQSPDRPFFLVVSLLATHSPWAGVPDRLVEQYRGSAFADIPHDLAYPFGRQRSESLYSTRDNPHEAQAQYYGAVSDIDEQVGRIVDELDSLRLREETTVVYTSDHGLNMGHHGIWGKGNATLPYNVVEESIRIPLIVNAPGAILGHQRRTENVTHLDTFQTILELTGCRCPSSAPTPYPGRSYASCLAGEPLTDAPDRVFAEYGNLRMVRTARHKLVRRYPNGPDELFDLERDPRETVNVIDAADQVDTVAELTSSLDDYFATFEQHEHSGRRVLQQPRHNGDEAWRDTRPPVLVEGHDWLDELENAIQARRAAQPYHPSDPHGVDA